MSGCRERPGAGLDIPRDASAPINGSVVGGSPRVPKKPGFGCCGRYEAGPLGGDMWAGCCRSARGRRGGKCHRRGARGPCGGRCSLIRQRSRLFSPRRLRPVSGCVWAAFWQPLKPSCQTLPVSPWSDTFSSGWGSPTAATLRGAARAREPRKHQGHRTAKILPKKSPEPGAALGSSALMAAPGWCIPGVVPARSRPEEGCSPPPSPSEHPLSPEARGWRFAPMSKEC